MRKRISMVILCLIILSLTVMPGAALAGRPCSTFSATGEITGIEDTLPGENAFPISETEWNIIDRDICGYLEGDVKGDFVLTYSGTFSILSQEGDLTGTMVMRNRSFSVTGTVEPLVMVEIEGVELPLPQLTITGEWERDYPGNNWGHTHRSNSGNEGTFQAWLIFIPDEYGHVTQIVASSFEMTGQDQPHPQSNGK